MRGPELRAAIRERVLIADGSTGVALEHLLWEETGEERFPDGCPEGLTLSHPHVVSRLHRQYLEAGADVILTNTFGASPLSLASYGLADAAATLNREAALLARRAVGEWGRGWVLGSLGPGSLLPTLGQSSFDELKASYALQARELAEGGVDGFVVETCQDPLQAKAALAAVRQIAPPGQGPVVVVSITVNESGTMLLGTTVEAALATLLPYRPDMIGLNCGQGPGELGPALRTMASLSPVPLWFKPNAGIPREEAGRKVFPLGPAEFASAMATLTHGTPTAVVGGCCGTTPAHIRALAALVSGRAPAAERAAWEPSLSSLYHRVACRQEQSVLMVGERSNVNGSKRFREAVDRGRWEEAVAMAVAQVDEGAHAIDVCVDRVGTDPRGSLEHLVSLLRTRCPVPLFVDSASPAALAAACRLLPGRGVLNSVSFAAGDRDFRALAAACRETGCAMVVLAIDERGQAIDVEHKLEVLARVDGLRGEEGLAQDDVFFDPLVLPVATGDPSLRSSAAHTLVALERIATSFPHTLTVLGISNVSHGLAGYPRRVLNSLFLHLASQRGLTAAILHAGSIVPLHAIDPGVRAAGEAILLGEASPEALAHFLSLLQAPVRARPEAEGRCDPLEALAMAVVRGNRASLGGLVHEALSRHDARTVLEEGILRGMERVGELFRSGELQLPFVLAAAEVVREASGLLAPHLPRQPASRGTVVLATVEGDVHDIGKNLVGIILRNAGFEVVDLGIRVPVAVAYRRAREVNAVALGLSGLLTHSVEVMRRGLEQVSSLPGDPLPVLVGGAALSEEVTATLLAPAYRGRVYYGRDALHGLELVRQLCQGVLPAHPEGLVRQAPTRRTVRLPRPTPVPPPPFWGPRVDRFPVSVIRPHLRDQALIRATWRLPPSEGHPLLQGLIRLAEDWRLEGAAVWGFFHARPQTHDALLVEDRLTQTSVEMPVGRTPDGYSVRDEVAVEGEAVALFIATMGSSALEHVDEVRQRGEFRRYFLLHGLVMALTEACAEHVRALIASHWGVDHVRTLAPGMPLFPPLEAHRQFFQLLRPEQIGVSHTEGWQLVPECSTSGLVMARPRGSAPGH